MHVTHHCRDPCVTNFPILSCFHRPHLERDVERVLEDFTAIRRVRIILHDRLHRHLDRYRPRRVHLCRQNPRLFFLQPPRVLRFHHNINNHDCEAERSGFDEILTGQNECASISTYFHRDLPYAYYISDYISPCIFLLFLLLVSLFFCLFRSFLLMVTMSFAGYFFVRFLLYAFFLLL